MQRIKKNLKPRADSRSHPNERPPFSPDTHADTILHPHAINDVHRPSLSTKLSSRSLRTFNSRNLLPADESIGGPPSEVPYVNNAPLPPLPTTERSPDKQSHHPPRASSQSPTLGHYDQLHNFDLAPPPPKPSTTTIDGLSERLFSNEHLQVILRDPSLFLKFTTFLNRYKPQAIPILTRFLDTQKAIKAVEYANAIADSIPSLPLDASSSIPCAAALLDARFEARSRRAFETLVNLALPAFITHSLVQIVTDSVVKEITGTTIPMMRDLVGGLAEVFCLTDPGIEDNPIIYASAGKPTHEVLLQCQHANFAQAYLRGRILPDDWVWKG